MGRAISTALCDAAPVNDAEHVAAILAAPDEDAPRLAWAAALAERRDPRAELIRLQCASPEPTERIAALLAEHGRAWTARFRAMGASDARFVRGMVEHVAIDAEAFFDAAPALFAMTPLRSVLIREVRPHLARLCASSHLERLATLELRHNNLSSADIVRLADSPHVFRLRALDLGFNDIDDRGLETLARSQNLRALAKLDLKANLITDEGLASITAMTSLVDLDLAEVGFGEPGDKNAIGPEGAKRLAAVPFERLVLAGNPIGSQGVRALAESPRLENLRTLDVRDAQIGPDGAFALAAAAHLGKLGRLVLSMNPIGAEGARALASSPCLPAEMTLVIHGALSRYVDIGAEELQRLRARFAEVTV